MPIIVRVHYDDNTHTLVKIPADIWRGNGEQVDKLFVSDKEIVRLELDPYRETADTEGSNNHWPPKLVPSRFRLYKDKKSENEMQKANAVDAKELDSRKKATDQDAKDGRPKGADDGDKSIGKEKAEAANGSAGNS